MKKLPKSRARLFPLLAASFILLFSCVFDAPRAEQPQQEESPTPLSERLSIDDARVFFAEYAESLNPFPHYGTRNAEEETPPPIVLWNEAAYSEFLGHEVIEVPMLDFRVAVYHPDDPEIEASGDETPPENAVGRLISGLDPHGEIYYRLLYIVPEPEFLSKKGLVIGEFGLCDTFDDFSGSLRLFEITGGFVKGFTVSHGEIIRYLFPVNGAPHSDDDTSSGESPAGETRSDIPCLQVPYTFRIDYKYWEDDPHNDENGANTGTLVVGSREVTIYTDYCPPSNGNGGSTDPGTGGGGGGGGGGGTPPPSQNKCPICQTYGNCACCTECENNFCYCPICHGEQGTNQCDCCLVCWTIKDECTCCTVCHKKVCECKEPEDDCESFRKKLEDPMFKEMLDTLKTKAKSGDKEYGYKFKLGPNGEYIFSNLIEGSDTDQTIDFTGGLYGDDTKYDGCMHSHHLGCGNIFSFGDLFFIFNAYNKGVTAGHMGSFSYGLATPHGIYFLVADDRWFYQQWVIDFYTPTYQMDMEQIRWNESDFKNTYGIDVDTSPEDAENNFLKYITENFMGLGIMKYNPDTNKFQKKKYEIYGGVFYDEDCPE